MCGGTSDSRALYIRIAGLSPRVRGNREGRRLYAAQSGSIPACAGEPVQQYVEVRRERVYPRVCGGTMKRRAAKTAGQGLSPRVRGNPFVEINYAVLFGSIPACAGEPQRPLPRPRCYPVYPRVCGGTHPALVWGSDGQGLSPRVRGNPDAIASRKIVLRSIPACAGEPRGASTGPGQA